MFAQERLQAITDLLARKQKLSVSELQKSLKVSPATLRRDLAELEETGKVVRIHGGVMHPSYFNGEPSYDQKARESLSAKVAIAHAAADLVPVRCNVFIDSGSTCAEIGRRLLMRKDLTIFTNSIPLIASAQNVEAKIVCLGGELRVVNKALVGSLALDWLRNLAFDWAFLGASGVSMEGGLTTTELSEAAIKQEVMKRSKTRVLVTDASKWGERRAVCFGKFDEFQIFITTDFPEAALKEVRKQGVKVMIVTEENN